MMKFVKNEDKENLSIYNRILQKKRGYPFTLPPIGSPVIVLFSGGIDSISLTYLLLKKYKYHVFPIYYKLNRLNKNQYKSVGYFERYFLKKFPDTFHKVEKRNLYTIFSFRDVASFQEKVWQNISLVSENTSYYPPTETYQMFFPNNPTRLGHYSFGAYDYHLDLKYKHGINANTAFVAMTASDSLMRECTLSTLRAINTAVCSVTGDYSFQFSAPIEIDSNFSFPKKDLAAFAIKENVPIGESWSCVFASPYHCGLCQSCQERKNMFKSLGIVDVTKYMNKDILPIRERLIRRLKKWNILKQTHTTIRNYNNENINSNRNYQLVEGKEYIYNEKGYLIRVFDTDMYCMFYSKNEQKLFSIILRSNTKKFNIHTLIKNNNLNIKRSDIEDFLRISLTAGLLFEVK